jgi:hypothetical protein
MNKIQKYGNHLGKWDGTMRIMVATKKPTTMSND